MRAFYDTTIRNIYISTINVIFCTKYYNDSLRNKYHKCDACAPGRSQQSLFKYLHKSNFNTSMERLLETNITMFLKATWQLFLWLQSKESLYAVIKGNPVIWYKIKYPWKVGWRVQSTASNHWLYPRYSKAKGIATGWATKAARGYKSYINDNEIKL